MNNSERDVFIRNRIKEHYDEILKRGYEIVGVFLQGSQNYGLDIYDDEYRSDIDTKAIVLPTFQDFVESKEPISTTIIFDNNEHCDVKDIRIMFNMFKKSNVNFLEILFTKFFILNPKYAELLQPLFANRERLANANPKALLDAIVGMSIQKYIALKHPYPTIKDKIDKYGYDPKQLHHIYRMNQFIKRLNSESFESCLKANDREMLIDIKKGVQPLELAEKNAKALIEETENIKNEYIKGLADAPVDTLAYNLYKECTLEILKKWFKEQLN